MPFGDANPYPPTSHIIRGPTAEGLYGLKNAFAAHERSTKWNLAYFRNPLEYYSKAVIIGAVVFFWGNFVS